MWERETALALARYRVVLADEVAEQGRPRRRPGSARLPGGEADYAALIRAETTTERTAQELHEPGWR